MNKRNRLKILGVSVALTCAAQIVQAQDAEEPKLRLPETVNSYQPAIVPVCDFDEDYLYFDRKFYFENTGGIRDNDEIWTSRMFGNANSAQVPSKLPAPINTSQSDVLFFISPDGNYAMFSGQYYENARKTPGYSIAKRERKGKWGTPKSMKIRQYKNDSTIYSATLSPDMKVALLALANEQSAGGMDLFVSFYQADDTWTVPKNLGTGVNTKYDEVSPFIAANNRTLYFVSNNPNSIGGFDLYMTERLDDSWTNWSAPKNLGKTFNTPKDDNNIWLTPLGDFAYVVSYDTTAKRQGIYRIMLPEEFRPSGFAYIRGQAMQTMRNKTNPIAGRTKIAVFQQGGDTTFIETSPSNAEFIIPVDHNGTYCLQMISEKYTSKTEFVSVEGDKPKVYTQNVFGMEKSEIAQEPRNEIISESLRERRTAILHFDYNLSELSEAESRKLKQIIEENRDNSQLKFYVSAHTDTLGTEEYNMKLSLERARTATEFLLKNGISRERIISQGFGEAQPLSTRREEQAVNRRVEIVVKED